MAIIKQVLRAISAVKPSKPKTPIWDPQTVFDWLTRSRMIQESLFEVSRRTAAILLLASGRRVHDLTLLSTAEDNIQLSEREITLWPTFGSKTDSAAHRQSGWLLSEHPEKSICPVTWVKKLISLAQFRRKEGKITNLFVSIIGQTKPASRTIIGGWIRSVLKEAGVDAPPGSFRAAVASAGWLENQPMEEILTRGNWKSGNTFKNFYCREIMKPNRGSQLLFNNFKAQ